MNQTTHHRTLENGSRTVIIMERNGVFTSRVWIAYGTQPTRQTCTANSLSAALKQARGLLYPDAN